MTQESGSRNIRWSMGEMTEVNGKKRRALSGERSEAGRLPTGQLYAGFFSLIECQVRACVRAALDIISSTKRVDRESWLG